MYNIDEKRNPAPGAPVAKFGGPDMPKLCSMCFGMKTVLETAGFYWRNLHDAWKSRKPKNLKPGDDYMAR